VNWENRFRYVPVRTARFQDHDTWVTHGRSCFARRRVGNQTHRWAGDPRPGEMGYGFRVHYGKAPDHIRPGRESLWSGAPEDPRARGEIAL